MWLDLAHFFGFVHYTLSNAVVGDRKLVLIVFMLSIWPYVVFISLISFLLALVLYASHKVCKIRRILDCILDIIIHHLESIPI